ncbi:MAG: helix-turn-helix transcriptional regulator [Pseudomonadota bacterium]
MTHEVDLHVGRRLRERRTTIGMTQQDLAEKVGVKFQQIQKYESGLNRISASRLWDISTALDCTVASFFIGLDYDERQPCQVPEEPSEIDELVKVYSALPPEQREAFAKIAKGMIAAA